MIKASELRKGKLIAYEGALYTVHESRHVAKGNKRSYVQALIKRFGGRAIVGVFLIWLGVIAFGVYVFRRKEESLPHLSFGALSLTAGL